MSEGRLLANRYRLGRAVGRGSMGTVFRAERLDDGAEVAVKLVHDDLVRDAEVRARFEREIETTAAFDHPGIVGVLDHGVDDGTMFLVMEFLRGRTLSQVAAQEAPLPPARVARLGCQMADALSAAHRAGLVHRDLKPENVMLLRDTAGEEQVRLMDFGLAVGINPESPQGVRMTAQGLRLGTPAFMAPEYITTGDIDHRSDLYSLGLMLYELACGALPFTGQGFQLMRHHLLTEPDPLSTRCDAPAWLTSVVDQLIEKNPDERVQTAGDLARRLREGMA
jgi:serine/threonine protein kinase